MDERRVFRRCAGCNAYDGQRVWRLKADPRLYWPGPAEGGDNHPHSKARDAGARLFVAESGLYESALETVKIGEAGLCESCTKRKATKRSSEAQPGRKRAAGR